MNREKILKLIFAVWLVLWLVFLFREDKAGQYRSLEYLYTHGHNDRVRYLMGEKLYDFLDFCKKNIPEGSTYELSGFETHSIHEVRARYFLWPLKSVNVNPDFKIVCGKKNITESGYKEYREYKGSGTLLVRK